MIGKLSTHFPYPQLKLLKKVKSSQIAEYSRYSAKYYYLHYFQKSFLSAYSLFKSVFMCYNIYNTPERRSYE